MWLLSSWRRPFEARVSNPPDVSPNASRSGDEETGTPHSTELVAEQQSSRNSGEVTMVEGGTRPESVVDVGGCLTVDYGYTFGLTVNLAGGVVEQKRLGLVISW
jgi:hypothetical protein